MRLKITRILAVFILLGGGLPLLGLGVFATQLGIDNNPDWGGGRIRLVIFAASMLVGGLALCFPHRVARLARAAWRWFSRLRAVSALRMAWARANRSKLVQVGRAALARWNAFPPVARVRASPRLSAALAGGSAILMVLFIYLWYITGGTLTQWFKYNAYFDRLANAFLAGQLSLLEEPPEALTALENPYDYRNRAGIDYLWDASLYQGKYYYYWGPVPALVLAAVKTILPIVIDDQYLVFFFCAGLVVALALFMGYLREQYFPGAPPWTLFPLVTLGGLAIPVFWLINHPNVYEAAISGGQFFLILGLYAAVRGVVRRPAAGWLILAGLAWGAAANSRLSLGPAVLFFAALFGWRILRCAGSPPRAAAGLACLGVPLLLWAAGLGWYNAARFGNLFETGHRYQLTGLAMPVDYSFVTSPAYAIPNAYNYIFRLPVFGPRGLLTLSLPFIEETAWPFFIHLPEHYYYSEQVAGLLPVVPGITLAFLPLLGWLKRFWWWLNEWQPGAAEAGHAPAWLWWALVGGAACAGAPLLVFISSSLRYLADVTPLMTLLAAMGFWWGVRFLSGRPGLRGLLFAAGCVLILVSALASLVVVFHSADMRFEVIRPELYGRIADLLAGHR